MYLAYLGITAAAAAKQQAAQQAAQRQAANKLAAQQKQQAAQQAAQQRQQEAAQRQADAKAAAQQKQQAAQAAQAEKQKATQAAAAAKKAAVVAEKETPLPIIPVPQSEVETMPDGLSGMAGLGAAGCRPKDPFPYYGTVKAYRQACQQARKANKALKLKFNAKTCRCVDMYGRIYPQSLPNGIQPQVQTCPTGYVKNPQYMDPAVYGYQAAGASQPPCITLAQYYAYQQQLYQQQLQLQQQQNQQWQQQQYYQPPQYQSQYYQQPYYGSGFNQGPSYSQYGQAFGSNYPLMPGAGGAYGPMFSEEAELATQGTGDGDIGLPADTMLFQGGAAPVAAAPTGASITMPVEDIAAGELVVADDMAMTPTQNQAPGVAPEQVISPNPIQPVPAAYQAVADSGYGDGGYMVDGDYSGLSGLGELSPVTLALGAGLLWYLMKKRK